MGKSLKLVGVGIAVSVVGGVGLAFSKPPLPDAVASRSVTSDTDEPRSAVSAATEVVYMPIVGASGPVGISSAVLDADMLVAQITTSVTDATKPLNTFGIFQRGSFVDDGRPGESLVWHHTRLNIDDLSEVHIEHFADDREMVIALTRAHNEGRAVAVFDVNKTLEKYYPAP